jgi:hypothetical protein
MTDLAIGRLSATVHGDDDLAPRVGRMLTQLAQRRLDEALQAADLPPGDWCVRRLDVGIAIDPARPDGALETQWAAAVVDALRRALVGGSSDVVHYQRRADALADLVVSAAAGRAERSWAWRRIGLLAPDDPQPESAPAEMVLAVLLRHPSEALGVVVRTARVAGIAALHRLLGARGWKQLAQLVCPGFDVEVPLAERATTTATLTAELLSRSTLAAGFRQSRLRPDPPTARAWAVLIAADADPSVLSRPAAAAVVDELRHVLAGGSRPSPAVQRVAGTVETAETPASSGALPTDNATTAADPAIEMATPARPDRFASDNSAGHRTEEPAAGVAPTVGPAHEADGEARTGRTSRPTLWAGLLFLLNTAPQAGVPDDLLADPTFAARSLPWVLHGIARQLVPAAADEPAVLAFAGLADPPTSPPSDLELQCLGAHAHRWAAATAARLERHDEDPLAVVAELALRRGEVVVEPGWVETHLPLTEVDVDIRRAGLDIDPGWVPWLGAVVRFVYA